MQTSGHVVYMEESVCIFAEEYTVYCLLVINLGILTFMLFLE